MKRRIITNTIIVLISMVIGFLVAEMIWRISSGIRHGSSMLSPSNLAPFDRFDTKLGWKPRENYLFKGSKKDASGYEYDVAFSIDRSGFRWFGNINSYKKRIFFLGDSFTEAAFISNNKTYYGQVAESLTDFEFFAYGCGGYGTLQEFMIIDEFIDIIKPQLIVIQLCSNDFINNDFMLELKSYSNNNGIVRPYIDENGNTVYKNPRTILTTDKLAFLANYSKLLSTIDIFTRRYYANSIENDIEKIGQNHREFQRSSRITEHIIEMIKKRTAGIPIAVFCVDECQPYYDEFQKISKKTGLDFIDGIPQAIKTAENQGLITREADKSHWNELGHKITSEKLSDYIKVKFNRVENSKSLGSAEIEQK